MNRKMIDITGLRSGRTVALSPRRRKDGRLDWKCLCDYGTTHYTGSFAIVAPPCIQPMNLGGRSSSTFAYLQHLVYLQSASQ